jgi:hypothetical protein
MPNHRGRLYALVAAVLAGGLLVQVSLRARQVLGSTAIAFDDHAGFTQIFDGKTLKGWDGDLTFWRVENGAIVGETTTAHPLKVNTFMIWRGGEPSNFDLRVEFRINSTNSGVQYRSAELTDVGKWVLKGYQADIDFENQYSGMLYEERGRMFLAPRGTVGYVVEGQPSRTIGRLESSDVLKASIKVNDWNQFQVIARGNMLMHIMNGHVMAAAVDDDAKGRSMKGLIGLQLHVGPPMKVEFRNIWLKNLP